MYFTFFPLSVSPQNFPLVTEEPNNDFESPTLLPTSFLPFSPLPKDCDIDNCISFILDQFGLEKKSATTPPPPRPLPLLPPSAQDSLDSPHLLFSPTYHADLHHKSCSGSWCSNAPCLVQMHTCKNSTLESNFIKCIVSLQDICTFSMTRRECMY